MPAATAHRRLATALLATARVCQVHEDTSADGVLSHRAVDRVIRLALMLAQRPDAARRRAALDDAVARLRGWG